MESCRGCLLPLVRQSAPSSFATTVLFRCLMIMVCHLRVLDGELPHCILLYHSLIPSAKASHVNYSHINAEFSFAAHNTSPQKTTARRRTSSTSFVRVARLCIYPSLKWTRHGRRGHCTYSTEQP